MSLPETNKRPGSEVIPTISLIRHHGFTCFLVAAAADDADLALRKDESFVQFPAGSKVRTHVKSPYRGKRKPEPQKQANSAAPILRIERKSERQLNSLEVLAWICCLAKQEASPRLCAFCGKRGQSAMKKTRCAEESLPVRVARLSAGYI